MRNYPDHDPQIYSRPPRSQLKKPTINHGNELNLAKSPKKITYALPPMADDHYNKENTLHNCRSTLNIEFPADKSVSKVNKKRSNSFLNKSQAVPSKNQYYLGQERTKAKSRWETAEYPQTYAYDSGLSETVPSMEPAFQVKTKNYSKNGAGKFLQNYKEFGSMDVNIQVYQPYAEKKTPLYPEQPYDPYPKFGLGLQSSCYKPQKKQNPNSKSTKNIPFYQKIKNYEPFRTEQPQQYMHNTYSYADYKGLADTLTPTPVTKTMNQSLGGYKYKQLIDSYELKNFDTLYGAGKGKGGLSTTQLTRNVSNKSEATKEPELDDFIVGQCKGEGRFGKVYMAIHKKTGFLCALKKIKKQSVKYMIDQFIQQVKIQLYLNHPKLVKIYGYFADSEHFYMLVEYMEEGCLYSQMKKNKKFQQQEAAQKLNQICEGIKEMHENNIVHRDLKPENVVLSHGVCKVCDFGWAAICEDRRQTYCGTLDYVCPEIVQGNAYDSSADIWCIGVLAYQMMVGKAPFYDISRQKTIQKIKSCRIDSFPAHLSKKAIKFIQMILKKNPDARVGIQELLDSDFLKSARK